MATTRKIIANGTETSVLLKGSEDDYICLTDMARYKDRQRTDYIIQNWMRSRSTIEYLGVWEQLHNPNFNPIEFDGFRNQAGLHSFSLTPKEWVQKTNAIGLWYQVPSIRNQLENNLSVATDKITEINKSDNSAVVTAEFKDDAETSRLATISTTKGQKHSIRIEYYDNEYNGILRLKTMVIEK